MFFDNWRAILRLILVGVPAYAALILWLRLSGKRTLSKWNAFDLVATVSLGSILATVVISKDIILLEGVVAFALIIVLQFCVTWLAVRYPLFGKVIKARPTMLLKDGRYSHEAMRAQRVTKSEILAAVRGAGFASVEDVRAIVLETDGSFSVIRHGTKEDSALADVHEQ